MNMITQERTMLIEQPQQSGMLSANNASHAVALAAAVLDKRIITAMQFPRSVARFKMEARELLSQDIETARSAEYSKPVGGGKVTGPSVRLTEIACMCWRNIEVEVQEPIINEKSVTVQAFAWDLERNTRVPGIATTSIVKTDGSRYPQHLIETSVVATAAKARRNAVLAVIPRAYINDILEHAKEVAIKNRRPLEEVRTSMLDHFARTYKVDSKQVFEYLNVAGADDITYEQIDELRAVAEAIKEGEKPEAYFGKAESKADQARRKRDERRAAEQAADEAQASSPQDA